MSEELIERPDWGVLVTLNRVPAYILQNVRAFQNLRLVENPGEHLQIAVGVRWSQTVLDELALITRRLRIRVRSGTQSFDLEIANIAANAIEHGGRTVLDLTDMQFVTQPFRGLKLPKKDLTIALVVTIDGKEAERRIGEIKPPPNMTTPDVPVPPPVPVEVRKQLESAIRLEAITIKETATVRHGLRVHLVAPVPGTDLAWLLRLKAFVRSPVGQCAHITTHATPTGGSSWTLFMETSTTERLFAVDDPRFTEDDGIVLTIDGVRQAFPLLLGVNLRLNA